MKAVIQRVSQAKVEVDGKIVGKIGVGLFTLLGIEQGDTEKKAAELIQKIVNIRIFEDDAKKMNLSLLDIKGDHLIVSQFTLLADTSSGRRPNFLKAEKPELAQPLYEKALKLSQAFGVKTEAGIFAADMSITLVNQGPVTLTLEC